LLNRNELLSEYPELAEELEEEIKKMEAENQAKQAEIDGIQQQQQQQQYSQTNDGANVGGGPSFVSKSSSTTEEERNIDSEGTVKVENDDLIVGEEELIHAPENERDGEDSIDDLDTTANTTTTTDIESPSDAPKEDYTLSHLAIETLRAFVKHAKDDAKRIFELVVPVMQPLLTAGDVAWRQIKALFVRAREAYSASQDASSENTASTSKQQTFAEVGIESGECEDITT
jgi:hypothetical protein